MKENKNLPTKPPFESGAMTLKEKRQAMAVFGRHLNSGQVKYLAAAHLDVFEWHREGVRFSDAVSGRTFIDAFTSAGSFNVGRRNPEILAALVKALSENDLGTYNLVSPHKVALAKKLTTLAPGDVNRIFFAAGGGDAIDGAIKLARGATGRTEVISTIKAYHGHTGLALSANGKEHYRHFFEPLDPAFRFVPFNSLAAVEAIASKKTAAVILEPVQGEAGIFVADDDYLRGLRKLCNRLGIMLIFDEIQTGFGRTGKFFACEYSGVVPDIMTVAKSIGGGIFPNAAVIYRDSKSLVQFVEDHPDFHRSVAGGSDLGCRVSLAVIEVMEKNRLWENSERQGARLREALLDLKEKNPRIIKEIRGRGLMIGIEYIHEFMGPMMSDALAKNGVFAAYSGNAPQVMRFMLPLAVTDEETTAAIEAIRGAVKYMKTILPLALQAAKIPPVLRALNNERVQTALFGALRKIEDAVEIGKNAIRGRRR